MNASIETISLQRCCGGTQGFYRHQSETTGTSMGFTVFVPSQAADGPVPVLYYLAGLTCTEETATIKAGAQRHAAHHGVMLVMPDTSPRGAGVGGEAAVGLEEVDEAHPPIEGGRDPQLHPAPRRDSCGQAHGRARGANQGRWILLPELVPDRLGCRLDGIILR